jgi:hypothetical protein
MALIELIRIGSGILYLESLLTEKPLFFLQQKKILSLTFNLHFP